MKGAEILHSVQEKIPKEEMIRRVHKGKLSPVLTALLYTLPEFSGRSEDFLRRRMALVRVHFVPENEGLTPSERVDWNLIRRETDSLLPQVPKKLTGMPSGWRAVFKDALELYGDPNG